VGTREGEADACRVQGETDGRSKATNRTKQTEGSEQEHRIIVGQSAWTGLQSKHVIHAAVSWLIIHGAATGSPAGYPRCSLTSEIVCVADVLAVLVVVASGVPEGSTDAVEDTVSDCNTTNTLHARAARKEVSVAAREYAKQK